MAPYLKRYNRPPLLLMRSDEAHRWTRFTSGEGGGRFELGKAPEDFGGTGGSRSGYPDTGGGESVRWTIVVGSGVNLR